MTPQAVAPVVTALVDPDCTLNGQILVSCAGGLRSTGTVERRFGAPAVWAADPGGARRVG